MNDDNNDRPQDAKIIGLVPGETDKMIADRIRAHFNEAVRPLLMVMDEATKNGFDLNMSIKTDGLGKAFVESLTIAMTKKF